MLDDLERILKRRETGLPRVDPTHQPVLGALIETFANAETDSRLLLTSRYRFTLPDHRGRDLAERLHAVPLPPMDETGARSRRAGKCWSVNWITPSPLYEKGEEDDYCPKSNCYATGN